MNRRRMRAGFSLVEMMVVIVIIGMLAAAVAVGVRAQMETARTNVAKTGIKKIEDAVEMYQAENGSYPDNLGEFFKPADGSAPVLRNGNQDPWGNPYQLILNEDDSAQPFEIVSYGADGKEGGTGPNQDLSSLDE